MNPVLQEALGAIVRWALAGGAGLLVQRGIWTESDATIYVAAAAMGILSLGWSLFQKYRNRVKFLTGLMLPGGTTESAVNVHINAGKPTPTVMTPPDTKPGVPKANGIGTVLVLILATGLTACAAKAPPTLSPKGVTIWQANHAVVVIGQIQDVAIKLNAIEVCPLRAPCRPLLSNKNTRIVVDAVAVALPTIQAVPLGWKATALAAIDRISQGLDNSGMSNLSAYLQAARTVLDGI